jgi:flagellar biosynthesis protein FlhB
MAEESNEERTEAPTDKRRSEAREKGNVAKSAEVNSALVLLVGILVLKISASWMFRHIETFMQSMISMIAHPEASSAFVFSLIVQSAIFVLYLCMPIAVAIIVIGVASNILQIGFLFTLKPLEPKLEKLDVISGMKNMFSMRSVVEAVKNILKLVLIAVVAYIAIRSEFSKFLSMWDTSPYAILVFMLNVAFKIVVWVALILIIIAILDYAYQRYEHEKKLKMTKQEVKEERKQMDGDPQIKGRIRSLQREMARRRMMQEVPKATVVVTNPTHLAIAIRYIPEEMQTPKVIAKGKQFVAERIKKLAMESGIPIVEDKPLARAMFDKVDPGDDIPVEFFTAVAELLAYVYRLKKRTAA